MWNIIFYGVICFIKIFSKKGIFPTDKRLQADDIMGDLTHCQTRKQS